MYQIEKKKLYLEVMDLKQNSLKPVTINENNFEGTLTET